MNTVRITKELGQSRFADIPIDQYSLEGVYINTYISLMDAYRQTNIHFKYISACLLGKQKSSNGYVFVKKAKSLLDTNPKKMEEKYIP